VPESHHLEPEHVGLNNTTKVKIEPTSLKNWDSCSTYFIHSENMASRANLCIWETKSYASKGSNAARKSDYKGTLSAVEAEEIVRYTGTWLFPEQMQIMTIPLQSLFILYIAFFIICN
jgi:hypothetical protein